jgi:hypothetical protein
MKRNATIDALKFVMALLVIGIHTVALKDSSAEIHYFFTQTIFRMAVPFFFIVNGYFLCEYLQSEKPVLPWLKRSLYLYLTWSTIYLYFYIPDESNFFKFSFALVKTLIEGYFHLWYLAALICGSLLLILVRRRLSDALLFLSSIFLFAAGCSIQYAGNYHLLDNQLLERLCNNTDIYRNFLFFAFPMLTLGYFIAKYKHVALQTKTLWSVFVLASGLLICEGLFNTYNIGDKNETFDLLLTLIVFCPTLFLIASKSQWRSNNRTVSDLSTAMYFSHPLMILLLRNMGIHYGAVMFFSAAIATLFLSYIILLVNKKFPYFI